MTNLKKLLLIFCLGFSCTHAKADNNWSGSVAMEFQGFPQQGTPDQKNQYNALIFKPEYLFESKNRKHQIQFAGFARYNHSNKSQNHADIRELYWSYAAETWEIRSGIRKVFWGVTESRNLTDILNQTDTLEGFSGEEKLGQPMINFAYITDWGTLDFFILTAFRTRAFPNKASRLRFPIPLSNNEATYDSSLKQKQVDIALRYSHYIGNWDFGISHFYGTSREPRIIAPNGQPIPHYDLIQQTGLDVQATLESWLWKFEGIYRSGMDASYFATTFGLEYSFFDLYSSGVDLGIVIEYLYDDRQKQATTSFEDDTLFAIRLALNDEQSTEALFGMIVDNAGEGNIFSLEASRRLGDSFKLNMEAYLFFDIKPNERLAAFRNDDYFKITLGYFF